MKKVFLMVGLLLINNTALATTCINLESAKSTLSNYLSNPSNLQYPESFDYESLTEDLEFFDGYFEAQTTFEIDVDCGYGDTNCGIYNSGSVIASISCDKKVNLVFSIDHD